MLINKRSISQQVCLKKFHTLLYIAYFHVYQINRGFNIYNNLKNLIVEALHDIISNGGLFLSNPKWWVAAILYLLITATPDQNKTVTIVLSMVENPHLDILHGHSNRFVCQ